MRLTEIITESRSTLSEIKKGAKDSNGVTSCWKGYHAAGTKKSATTGKQVRNCVPTEGVAEGQLDEVSKDYKEIDQAEREIEKIVSGKQRWAEFTPEEYAKVLALSKITGRRHKMSWRTKIEGTPVGTVLELMSRYIQRNQRDSGQMPEFSGRASTTSEMANQIAVQTNGTYKREMGRVWTDGLGRRNKDPSDFIEYDTEQDKASAMEWLESKGKKIHWKERNGSVQSGTQIGKYVIENADTTMGYFSDNPVTTYKLSVRLATTMNSGVRQRQDITDQQAASLKDIANTKNNNAMQMIRAVMDMVQGEQEIKKIIDQSKKINPADKTKLDKIIAGAGDFKDVAEGWSDNDRTPYAVYINGKEYKQFQDDNHARAVMNKLKAKFSAEGRNPDSITIAPAADHLKETHSDSGVERAILNRIMVAHTDLLMKHGPERVMQAAEEVADDVGDVDEIGTSDVSAYVAQVQRMLGDQ
jgi:hypothetical protein